MDEVELEQELFDKELNAPRVTVASVDAVIMSEKYYVFPGSTVTVCCLTLENGYAVVGHSACASPENFDRSIGCNVARDDARRQIWALEGYALKGRLFRGEVTSG